MPIRRVQGKLLKQNAMEKHQILRRYLPETYRFNSSVFERMMKRYPTLFIKPDTGSLG